MIFGGIMMSLIAVALGVYVSFTARCKGKILSNPWIWMSKEEYKQEIAKLTEKEDSVI